MKQPLLPLKLRRWRPSVQHGAQVSLRKPRICDCSQQETQHKGMTRLFIKAAGHRSDTIFSGRADFSLPMFCLVLCSGRGREPPEGSGHFEEQTDQSPPGLRLPQRGENVGHEKKRESKPNRFQSDPNSSFSQKQHSCKPPRRRGDARRASTEHQLRATRRGSQRSQQAFYVDTRPSPARLQAEPPPWGQRRSAEERLRPRPRAGEPQAEPRPARKATRAAASRPHGAKSP